MSDDHQAMAMGCMGNTEIETPNLDRLAADGVLFRRCYATSPLCMASRATVMTGMYEYRTGCNFQTGDLDAEVWQTQAYPIVLRKTGYRTAFAGKFGFRIREREGDGAKGLHDPSSDFDKWGALLGGQGYYVTEQNPNMRAYASEYPHITRALGAFGRDFIRESAEAGQPFCLSISFKAPHKPHFQIDIADQRRYPYTRFSFPEGYGLEGADRLPLQPKLGRQYLQRGEWDQPGFYQEHIKAYYQLISGMDAAVGMIIEALEESGVADDTVIIYTSDNGYFAGAHGLQGKVLPYERSARIPLIIRDPRVPVWSRGRTAAGIVANIDFAPTILDLAGVPVPGAMDGHSLVPMLHDPGRRVRTELGIVQNWDLRSRDMTKGLAVVSEDFKYIYWCYADSHVPVAEELFDLRADPFESTNVAERPAHADSLQAMREKYDAFHRQWTAGCVNSPDYQRLIRIFDRHVPWEEKRFKTKVTDDMWGTRLRRLYEEQTKAAYPLR